ncbi:MAG: leucyl/phenylalanyl-tRNA--protein transferase [Chlorobi bacterium]|nr:leucyl/phenylalanyl-tRNA--protein transferase [Chlorobiota bacterium]
MILEPELIISAYSQGYFPMADEADGDLYWHNPDPRSIFPLKKLKMPRSFRKILDGRNFEFKINTVFEEVIRSCADRDDTWISNDIIMSYIKLHRSGHCHSVETFENGELVGGLYGVQIGGVFFGESMFSRVDGASKAAFYKLRDILLKQGFSLFDSQYINEHTKLLGAVEIPKILYLKRLEKAIDSPCFFSDSGEEV